MSEPNLLSIRAAFLQLFEMLGVGYPAEAATYYVLYTSTFPDSRTFGQLYRDASKLVEGTKEGRLRRGRDELLKSGFVARVLFPHEAAEDFGHEAYIPANPMIIWEEGEARLEERLGSDLFEIMKSSAQELSSQYELNFGKYGIGIEEGILTIFYSGRWINFTLLNLCRRTPRSVSLSISGFSSFVEPSLRFFHKSLDTGSSVRVLLDHKIDTDSVKELKSKYGDRFATRFAAVGTTHRMTLIDDVLALDTIRILSLESSAPSYVGTLYVETDSTIARLREHYEGRWAKAEE